MRIRILTAIMLVGALVLCGCSSGKKTQTVSTSTTDTRDTTSTREYKSLKDSDKTLYNNVNVEDVCNDFDQNSFRAGEKYKDYKIALIGKVNDIAADGKTITIDTPSNKMNLTCKSKDDNVLATVKTLSKGDRVLVCGTVNKSTEEEFTISTTNISAISEDSNYNGGVTDANGHVYTSGELRNGTIGGLSYKTLNTWSEEKDDVLDSGYKYELGDNETLRVYLVDFNTQRKNGEKEKNEGKEWKTFVETSVEDYLTGILSPEIMDYKTSSDKVNGISFDTYKGIAQSISRTVQAEMYYSKAGDNMIIVSYVYEENPIHSAEVALVVGSISVN